MSRSRWVVLLGPPLIVVAAAGALVVRGQAARVNAGALGVPQPASACLMRAGDAEAPRLATAAVGTWWRSRPVIDASGSLTGWTLTAGDASAGPATRLDLPAASAASGPDRGRVIIAADDGARSSVTILDVPGRCDRVIDLGTAVARRAIDDPLGDGVLVHLLDRASRADLGIWQVAPDGRRTPILGPIEAKLLEAAGLGRVWATNLAASRDGQRLAVQSCDPEACVTRILDRTTGRVTTLLGDQGDVVGFAGDSLITMAACHGLPCGVLAWTTTDRGAGTAGVIADSTLGAAIASNERIVLAVPDAGRDARAVAVSASGSNRRDLGSLAPGAIPLSRTSRDAGIEAGPDAVAVVDSSGLPSLLEVQP